MPIIPKSEGRQPAVCRSEFAIAGGPVPRYDFNWQLKYRTSLKIPKGSRMEVRFTYDNSSANRQNPDPNKWIYYGDQSWEEMGTPNVGFLVDNTEQDPPE